MKIHFSEHTLMPLWGIAKFENTVSKQKFIIEINFLYFQVFCIVCKGMKNLTY